MDQLAIGKIGGSFGVEGWVKVLSFSGESGHFLELESVLAKNDDKSLNPKSLTLKVEGVEAHADGVVMKFAGYETPEAARVLAGLELWVPRDKGAHCADGEFYIADLVGCLLCDKGNSVGRVVGVSEGGNGFLLEIDRSGVTPGNAGAGATSYVPFSLPFVGEVDMKTRRIELLTPWVLE